eukprot:TRINITY_DN39706_c0_g1_i1.p1 TRINITY_DN39706_c0_g1~~TRINITY_DN39706_c0_g1_i1.p1  ORF type:complete len:345 (-),score=28.80 TRINITY_DN39706_c0_g1_i1:751-1722(-)
MGDPPRFQAWQKAMGSSDSNLDVALHAALAGVKAVLGTVPSQIHTKDTFADLICEADVAADKAVHEVLASRVPTDSIVSEELAPSVNGTSCRLWIVDPLDATTAFVLGQHQVVSTMVSFMCDDRLEAAVIAFPFTDDWWYAVRGKGSWHNGVRVNCKSCLYLRDAWVDLNQYGDYRFETRSFARLDRALRKCCRLVTRQVPHSGVVCKIVDGQLAAVVHDNHDRKLKQAVWDLAPQILLVEEAGGIVVDSCGVNAREILERKQWTNGRIVGLRGPIVAAASKQIAQQLLDKLDARAVVAPFLRTVCVASAATIIGLLFARRRR